MEKAMQTAKLFKNGRSQAVRLPKEFRFEGPEVFIAKIDNVVMLIPHNDPWAGLMGSLNRFSDDYMAERDQLAAQERETF